MSRIGLGIVTYNAPHKIVQSASSVPSELLEQFVIVNDGTPYDPKVYPGDAHVITHEKNRCVGAAKNTAISYLLGQGCEHIFVMEDDVVIRDRSVFNAYLELSRQTGLMHLNYALQGPGNMRLKLIDSLRLRVPGLGLANRVFDESKASPNPRGIAEYANGARIAFYPGCVGAFSYYHRSVLEAVGLIDERFQNALEHVEHTYRIIQAGFHPPFGWFADAELSSRYLSNIENCMSLSTIAADPSTSSRIKEANALFRQLHGTTPYILFRKSALHRAKVMRSLGSICQKFSAESVSAGHRDTRIVWR